MIERYILFSVNVQSCIKLKNKLVLWWGEMAPPLKRSPDLGNSFSRTESINV
jgi:hypothetical protein